MIKKTVLSKIIGAEKQRRDNRYVLCPTDINLQHTIIKCSSNNSNDTEKVITIKVVWL